MTTFRKIYFKNPLQTFLNSKGEEKKNIQSLLPCQWNDKDFDYSSVKNRDLGYGHVVKTGAVNGITVLDADTMDAYKQLCLLCPSLHKHYTVRTRRGMHIYFNYNPDVKSIDIDKVDLQNDNKLIIGEGTQLNRCNGEVVMYEYVTGVLLDIPQCILNKCQMKSQNNEKGYTTKVDYKYEVSDERITEILTRIMNEHPTYFTDYNKWLILTTVMKTIDKFDIWDSFNKKFDGYDYRGNLKTWETIKINISVNFFCKLLGEPNFRFHKVVKADELSCLVNTKRCKTMNQQYIDLPNNAFYDNNVLILQSNTGTGKTTCVAKHLHSFQLVNPNISILSITNLISLADQQLKTFETNGVKIYSYLEDKVNPAILMSENSVICINSLYKLHDCDFSNKILYMDEIHSLCNTLTHNDKLRDQKLVVNTLLRAIQTAHKVIVSDAHILNTTMHLLKDRINDRVSVTTHYVNQYNKFQGVSAIKYQDENAFFDRVKVKIQNGDSFSFACDSKSVVTQWYNWMWAEASTETQKRMMLFTSETDSEVCDDWKDKIIFYSPKISTGVDVTVLDQTEQFVYITGKSVSSITLYQMATRTRNMNQLSYYSCAKCAEAKYDSITSCADELLKVFAANWLGISACLTKQQPTKLECQSDEIYFRIYCENTYVLDLYNTNTLKFFEDELTNAGFLIVDGEKEECKLNPICKKEMKEIATQITDEKFESLVAIFDRDDDEDDESLPEGTGQMMKRVSILNLQTKEQILEYRDIIEDEYKMEQFLNYSRLNKSNAYCDYKLNELVNNKMAVGSEKNIWNKIKYIHILAYLCKIKDNVFDFDNIVIPSEKAMKGMKIQAIIPIIKTLYKKRDKTDAKDYDGEQFIKLYKSMLDNVIGKLNLIVTTRAKCKSQRDKSLYSIDENVKARYDKLLSIMSPPQAELIINYNIEEDENET
jgi:hypothetical protein